MAGKYVPSIGLRLQGFIREYQGKKNVGDTSINRGECVGLVEVWSDALKLRHTWGNAKDLLDNADPVSFVRVNNKPTNFPVTGDIVVWDASWGGGFGHTGICVTADPMDLTIFQQNDPDLSTPHLKVYSYDGVIGWLHPRATL